MIYLIQEYDDQTANTLRAFSTRPLAEKYLEYMRLIDSNSSEWFITEMELDQLDYEDKEHIYYIYLRENKLDAAEASTCDYNRNPDHIQVWGSHIDPKTNDAIVTVVAKSIAEAKMVGIQKYKVWLEKRTSKTQENK